MKNSSHIVTKGIDKHGVSPTVVGDLFLTLVSSITIFDSAFKLRRLIINTYTQKIMKDKSTLDTEKNKK